MFASFLIIAVSVVLLIYWFRYSCIMLLRDAAEHATGNALDQIRVQELRERLRNEPDLDPLHVAIQRDYQLLSYLLQNASGLELNAIEDRLLLWDYKLMRCWYRVTRTIAPEQAREALSEMATVLSVLSGKIGERAGVQS